MNILLLMNGSLEDTNLSRRKFQESIRAFHPKAQLWKSKLQSCPEPSKVGFMTYRGNTFQVNLLINNVLSGIEQENGTVIEITIKSEVAFLMNKDIKGF